MLKVIIPVCLLILANNLVCAQSLQEDDPNAALNQNLRRMQGYDSGLQQAMRQSNTQQKQLEAMAVEEQATGAAEPGPEPMSEKTQLIANLIDVSKLTATERSQLVRYLEGGE
jgi:hypothetical protein